MTFHLRHYINHTQSMLLTGWWCSVCWTSVLLLGSLFQAARLREDMPHLLWCELCWQLSLLLSGQLPKYVLAHMMFIPCSFHCCVPGSMPTLQP
jgi:hypothetical protein